MSSLPRSALRCAMTNDLRGILASAATAGEIVSVVYRRGSQPRAVREIVPLAVYDDEITAHDLAAGSDKTFKLEHLELAGPNTEARAYDPAGLPAVETKLSVQEAVAPHIVALESSGWAVDLSERRVSLSRPYLFYKNGKPRRHYVVTIGYEEFTIDAFDDADGRGLQRVTRPSKRPYYVVSTSLPTRTFVHLPGAVLLFLEEARRLCAQG